MIKEEVHMIMEREAGAPESIPALGVGFWMEATQSARKSKLAGHPIFEDREWVKIIVPGDRQSTIERPATDRDKQRFPRAYSQFKERENKTPLDGMPIEQWPQVTRSMAMTLRASNVFTVEALASIHDGNIEKIGSSGRELRAKAQAFLAVSKDAAVAQEYKADSERKDAMIADLQRQIQELAARIEPEKRGPGRPRKIQDEEAA